MKRYIIGSLMLFLGFIGISAVHAGDITFALESPDEASTQVGISTIRGWAVSTEGIDHIDLAINGVYVSDLPYGSLRTDIGNAFPGIPDSLLSGFSSTYNYAKLNEGANTILVTVVDNDGASKSILINFVVRKFQKAFFQQPSPLSIFDAPMLRVANGDAILPNIDMEGKRFGILLGWDKKTQNFTIRDIVPAAYFPAAHDGAWAGHVTPDTPQANNGAVCGSAYMEFNVNNGGITGSAFDSRGNTYVIDGAVDSNGLVTDVSLKLDGQNVAFFEGSVTGGLMGGVWNDVFGCAGRWYGIQQ